VASRELEPAHQAASVLLLRTLSGWGADTIMREPHTEQYMEPACSTTAGTVRNLRLHLGHDTSTI